MSGQAIGDYTPAVDRSPSDEVEIPFTEKDLDRFEREPGGRTLAEILADLERRP